MHHKQKLSFLLKPFLAMIKYSDGIFSESCTENCLRIRVSGFPAQNSFKGSNDVDGLYERVIGEIRDDRSVYKKVGSEMWLYSQAFRWVFALNYTEIGSTSEFNTKLVSNYRYMENINFS